jgi:hypothetical protein
VESCKLRYFNSFELFEHTGWGASYFFLSKKAAMDFFFF